MYRDGINVLWFSLVLTLFGWIASLRVLSLLQGSWKEQLRMKFRNFRRPVRVEKHPRESEEEENEVTTQAPKRSRGGKVVMTDEDTQQYEEKAGRLRDECGKQNPKKKRVKRLMEATYNGRRAWVEDDLPRVFDVLEKFPPLKQPKHVSHTYLNDRCRGGIQNIEKGLF